MAKQILKAFFLTTFPSTQEKCPKIYAFTLVLPLNSTQFVEFTSQEHKFTMHLFRRVFRYHAIALYNSNLTRKVSAYPQSPSANVQYRNQYNFTATRAFRTVNGPCNLSVECLSALKNCIRLKKQRAQKLLFPTILQQKLNDRKIDARLSTNGSKTFNSISYISHCHHVREAFIKLELLVVSHNSRCRKTTVASRQFQNAIITVELFDLKIIRQSLTLTLLHYLYKSSVSQNFLFTFQGSNFF